MLTASAPGKLLLFGEHAVLYGQACIVTAISRRLSVSVKASQDGRFHIEAPGVTNTDFLNAAVAVVKTQWGVDAEGLTVSTTSEFTDQYGLGSSAAVVVAAVYALISHVRKEVSKKDVFDAAYEAVLSVAKKGSGFDVAASVFGGTLYFTAGGKVIEPLVPAEPIPLIVGYTGGKASTTPLVDMVAQKYEQYPEKVDRIMQAIGALVDQAKPNIVAGDWQRVGTLMNFNHEYLRDLGVSSEPLEKLIFAAKEAGAYGAKLSGAGGGDCMIAVAPPDKVAAVKEAIRLAGGEVLELAANAEGLSLSSTDNQQELFVVVDEKDNVIAYKTRQECHQDRSLIHRSVNVLVYDKKGRLLLQKRSRTKDTSPGFWTVSASGHVEKGESYEQTAKRELKEELGIEIPVTEGTKFVFAYERETEMEMVFEGEYDGPFIPHPQEIDEVMFVAKSDLPRKLLSREIELTPSAYEILKRVKFL